LLQHRIRQAQGILPHTPSEKKWKENASVVFFSEYYFLLRPDKKTLMGMWGKILK